MKKFLSLLGTVIIVGSGVASVAACGSKEELKTSNAQRIINKIKNKNIVIPADTDLSTANNKTISILKEQILKANLKFNLKTSDLQYLHFEKKNLVVDQFTRVIVTVLVSTSDNARITLKFGVDNPVVHNDMVSGLPWIAITNQSFNAEYYQFKSITLNSNAFLYACSSQGFFVSENNGLNFSKILNKNINEVFKFENKIFVEDYTEGNLIFSSTNGKNFNPVPWKSNNFKFSLSIITNLSLHPTTKYLFLVVENAGSAFLFRYNSTTNRFDNIPSSFLNKNFINVTNLTVFQSKLVISTQSRQGSAFILIGNLDGTQLEIMSDGTPKNVFRGDSKIPFLVNNVMYLLIHYNFYIVKSIKNPTKVAYVQGYNKPTRSIHYEVGDKTFYLLTIENTLLTSTDGINWISNKDLNWTQVLNTDNDIIDLAKINDSIFLITHQNAFYTINNHFIQVPNITKPNNPTISGIINFQNKIWFYGSELISQKILLLPT